MRTGKTYVGGKPYEFTVDGKLIVEEFMNSEKGIYYLDETGKRLYGWQIINGHSYYFSNIDGHMRSGRTYIHGDLYEFTDDGKYLFKVNNGFVNTERGTYYVNKGSILLGWQEIEGSTYYFSTINGYMRTGKTYVGGKPYEFTVDGRLKVGFMNSEKGIYYLDETGKKTLWMARNKR